MNISIDRSTMVKCHLQIQQFIISVTSPLIRLSDFYDRNFLHGAVFMDKGRRVSDGCAGFDLILLNAGKDTSILTACNLLHSQPSFLQSTLSCLQFLIYIQWLLCLIISIITQPMTSCHLKWIIRKA